MLLSEMSSAQLTALSEKLADEYKGFMAKELKLDMSRGKPGADQLNLSNDMMDILTSKDNFKSENGFDVRNYGLLDGIPEAKVLFSQMMGVSEKEIIVGGNSSLNLMYDMISRNMLVGNIDSEKPWGKCEKIKFLCPAPGYDRHFGVCEALGIEMITVPMTATGPDMNVVEELVAADDSIKGIWCVPMYSNPDGITYSDETVKRFAALKPKACDFRIFWDNAYCVHHLTEKPDVLLNILDECKKVGNDNLVYIFSSTSKVSFSGSGVSMLAASQANIAFTMKQLNFQTIGYDKINQLRHVRYFKNMDGILEKMNEHKKILAPKFDAVLEILNRELTPFGIAEWNKPNGGYFISVNTMNGCATLVVELCKKAGVVLTPAGATFPYGKDPDDKNIRLAPTFPPVSEVVLAAELFCLAIKIASVQKLLTK